MQALRSLQLSSRVLGRVATTRFLSASQKLSQQNYANFEDQPGPNDGQYNNNQDRSFEQNEFRQRPQRIPTGINRIELFGGVAADPQIMTSKNGNEFALFRLFTNVGSRRANGDIIERVEVHEICVFKNNINTVKNSIRKGSRVFVCGYLSYADRADGMARVARIIAENVFVAKTGADVARAQMNDQNM